MASREYHREYSREYYHRRRGEYIAMLGGECTRCSSKVDLQFDHVDPSTKSFPLGKLLNVSKDRAEGELKKCQLLCKICHQSKSSECGDTLRRRVAKGEVIKSSVLTEDVVRNARRLMAEGLPVTSILIKYPDVKKNTLRCALAGKTWRHVQ